MSLKDRSLRNVQYSWFLMTRLQPWKLADEVVSGLNLVACYDSYQICPSVTIGLVHLGWSFSMKMPSLSRRAMTHWQQKMVNWAPGCTWMSIESCIWALSRTTRLFAGRSASVLHCALSSSKLSRQGRQIISSQSTLHSVRFCLWYLRVFLTLFSQYSFSFLELCK